MTFQPAHRLLQCLAFLGIAALISACGTRLPISVHDVDTFHQVTIGPAGYTLGEGFPVVETHRNVVVHSIDSMPGAFLVVQVDPHPPRDFQFDADAEKRLFLRSLNEAYLTSAQYSEVGDWVRAHGTGGEAPTGEGSFEFKTQRRVKINVRATGENREELTGVLIVLREKNRTASVRVVGPHRQAPALNRIAEKAADAIYWADSRRQPRPM